MSRLQPLTRGVKRGRTLGLAAFLLSLVMIFQVPGEPVQAGAVTIKMSNPSCVQSQPAAASCSIVIGNLSANGSDISFSRVELLVDNKLRMYMAGFFESSAYFTYSMVPDAFTVSCGGPNASGNPNYGKSYLVTANAYMADGTSASNTMNVFCPAFVVQATNPTKTYLPTIRK